MTVKPYYDHGGATIYHGDCRELFPLVGVVDAIITDPPYNVLDEEWDDLDEKWLDFAMEWSSLILFTPGIANIWKYPPADWVLCWLKPGSTRRNGTGGFNHWEPILQYGKNKWPVDMIRLPPQRQIATGGHPCPKPIKLFKWLIEGTTAETILDPFMGSGTTLRAAKDLGRKSIGIEIEERYCEIAANRLGQEVFEFND